MPNIDVVYLCSRQQFFQTFGTLKLQVFGEIPRGKGILPDGFPKKSLVVVVVVVGGGGGGGVL